MQATADLKKLWRANLGSYMEERRVELDLTWGQAADRAGMSPQGLRDIRDGASTPRRLTKRAIEKALQWESGSIDRILAGEEPRPLPKLNAADQPTPDPAHPEGARPAPWLQSELQRAGPALHDLATHVGVLRDIGQRFGYSIADLLLEAGLAQPHELTLRNVSAASSDRFEEAIRRIEADPNLQPGEKKDLIESAKKLREARVNLAQNNP